MLEFPIPPYHKKRQRGATPKKNSTPALALVSAVYDAAVPHVVLTFNQEINTDSMDLGAITVADGQFNNALYVGSTTTGLTADSVTVELVSAGEDVEGQVLLSAGATNGIVCVADGSEWDGVTNLVLPFP